MCNSSLGFSFTTAPSASPDAILQLKQVHITAYTQHRWTLVKSDPIDNLLYKLSGLSIVQVRLGNSDFPWKVDPACSTLLPKTAEAGVTVKILHHDPHDFLAVEGSRVTTDSFVAAPTTSRYTRQLATPSTFIKGKFSRWLPGQSTSPDIFAEWVAEIQGKPLQLDQQLLHTYWLL